MDQLLADLDFAEFRTNQTRREYIGKFLELIAARRVAFDFDAQSAQLFDVHPNRRARDADFRGDLGPRHYHRGVLRQHVNQLIDFAIGGGSGHNCSGGSLHLTKGLLKDPEIVILRRSPRRPTKDLSIFLILEIPRCFAVK